MNNLKDTTRLEALAAAIVALDVAEATAAYDKAAAEEAEAKSERALKHAHSCKALLDKARTRDEFDRVRAALVSARIDRVLADKDRTAHREKLSLSTAAVQNAERTVKNEVDRIVEIEQEARVAEGIRLEGELKRVILEIRNHVQDPMWVSSAIPPSRSVQKFLDRHPVDADWINTPLHQIKGLAESGGSLVTRRAELIASARVLVNSKESKAA